MSTPTMVETSPAFSATSSSGRSLYDVRESSPEEIIEMSSSSRYSNHSSDSDRPSMSEGSITDLIVEPKKCDYDSATVVGPPMIENYGSDKEKKPNSDSDKDDHKSTTDDNSGNIFDTAFLEEYLRRIINESMERGDIQTAVTLIILFCQHTSFRYIDDYELADMILCYLELLQQNGLFKQCLKIYNHCCKLLGKVHRTIAKDLIDTHFGYDVKLSLRCLTCPHLWGSPDCSKRGCRAEPCCLASDCRKSLQTSPHIDRKQSSGSGSGNSNSGDMDISNSNGMNSSGNQMGTLLLWCQTCGHGGHLECLMDWYDDSKNNLYRNNCLSTRCQHVCDNLTLLRYNIGSRQHR